MDAVKNPHCKGCGAPTFHRGEPCDLERKAKIQEMKLNRKPYDDLTDALLLRFGFSPHGAGRWPLARFLRQLDEASIRYENGKVVLPKREVNAKV